MSTPTKKNETITLDEITKLRTFRTRPRFTDEQVIAALRYQLDNNCSLTEAAATQGMTNQTLMKRRNELAEKMGATGTGAKAGLVTKSTKKATVKK